uniref:Uncharacterized protein n=1 Tax=Solanum lycopersicum TaxID=4081 RepID=A0A3Q7FGT9_SOLLC
MGIYRSLLSPLLCRQLNLLSPKTLKHLCQILRQPQPANIFLQLFPSSANTTQIHLYLYNYRQGYLQRLESLHSSVSSKWHPAIAATDMKNLSAANCLVSEQNENNDEEDWGFVDTHPGLTEGQGSGGSRISFRGFIEMLYPEDTTINIYTLGKFLDWENGVMGATGVDLELREGIAEEERGATSETATASGSTFDQIDGRILLLDGKLGKKGSANSRCHVYLSRTVAAITTPTCDFVN